MRILKKTLRLDLVATFSTCFAAFVICDVSEEDVFDLFLQSLYHFGLVRPLIFGGIIISLDDLFCRRISFFRVCSCFLTTSIVHISTPFPEMIGRPLFLWAVTFSSSSSLDDWRGSCGSFVRHVFLFLRVLSFTLFVASDTVVLMEIVLFLEESKMLIVFSASSTVSSKTGLEIDLWSSSSAVVILIGSGYSI